MKIRGICFWTLLPILLLVAGFALAGPQKAGPGHGAPTEVTECGTVLTEPGNYKLVNDLLDCPSMGVMIMGSDIILNVHGHQIACADNDIDSGGIIVYSASEVWLRNITIKNGHVSNCKDGIVLIQVEDSKVMNMTSTGNHMWFRPDDEAWVYGTGITLWFTRNTVIMHNHTYDNESHGIGSWDSSGNLFKHNTSTDNGTGEGVGGAGIDLSNENNSRVMCNRVHGNPDGIMLQPESSGNLIRGNLVTGNMGGIGMLGFAWDGFFWIDIPAGNNVRSNIVEDNSWVDFYEIYYDLLTGDILLQPDDLCMNAWEKNQFQTEVGPAGCFGTPVELIEKDVCALDDDHDD